MRPDKGVGEVPALLTWRVLDEAGEGRPESELAGPALEAMLLVLRWPAASEQLRGIYFQNDDGGLKVVVLRLGALYGSQNCR